MASMNVSKNVSGFGTAMRQNTRRTANSSGQVSVAVPKSKAGNLTTRTSDTVGTLTLATGHGIITSQVIDLYWDGGSRRGVVVGTVAGLSVPITGGTGTVLPADEFAIVAAPQVGFTIGIGDMTDVKAVGFQLRFSGSPPANDAILQFHDNGEDLHTYTTATPNKAQISDIEAAEETILTEASYLTGIVSNPSATVNATFQMSWVTD